LLPTTPNSCKKECKGLIQDSLTNNNTLIVATQRGEERRSVKNLSLEIEKQLKRKALG
jgi:hypothetical protein